MSEVEFTEEELAQLEGKDMDPEEAPVYPFAITEDVDEVESEEVPAKAEEAEEEKVAETTESLDYKAEYEKMKKANAGILSELVNTRRSWAADKEWRSAVEQRMEMLTNKLSGAEQEQEEAVAEDVEPDRDEDPLEWVAWKQRQEIAKQLEPLKQQEEEQERQRQYEQILNEAGRRAQMAEEDFIQQTGIEREKYSQALDELRFDRLKWYTAGGINPQDAMAIVEEEERQFVVGTLAEGKNPAAEVMRMHSLVKPQPVPNGRQEEPVAAPTEQVAPPNDRVSAVKSGISESGLQNVGGSAGKTGTITAEQFAEMDMDDPIFQKIASSEKLFARLNIHGEVTI